MLAMFFSSRIFRAKFIMQDEDVNPFCGQFRGHDPKFEAWRSLRTFVEAGGCMMCDVGR